MVPDTFHPFPHLPWDIRRIIWEMTIEPRTVSIRFAYGPPLDPADSEQHYTRVVSPTPVPAPLQTCAEARYLRLYQQVSVTEHFPCSDPEPEPYNNNRRYFWLNWDVDMIDIHDHPFAAFDRIAPMIKRLRFQSSFHEFIRDRDDQWWYERKGLDHIFPKIEEMHIVCAPGCKVEDWESAWYRHIRFMPQDKLFVVDAEDPSRILSFVELGDICGNYWSSWEA